MAGRKAVRPSPVATVQVPMVADLTTQRALDVVSDAVAALQTKGSPALSVTGSRSGGTALESLLARLVELGIITDDTTA